jgi:glutamate-1-semialdehyde aminotransferase
MTPPNLTLENSLRLFEKAAQLIPGGSQTSSKRPTQFAPGGYPIFAERGQGGHIVDVDGNEYIDLVQALGPIVLGYQYPAVDDAIRAQLARGFLYGLLSPLEPACAELICQVVPCAEMVRFFKGGGEATAAAARTVRAYTGRELILNSGYRGWPDVWSAENGDAGIPAVLQSSVRAFPKFDLDILSDHFRRDGDHIAAVFLDIQREDPPPGYLAAVKELCHHHGALLVYDEIVTGFRLAVGGAQEYYGVAPDLACFAKALANGMPLACVAGRRDVMTTMAERRISITYGGEALSLAAAVATLTELQTEPVISRLWALGARLKTGLNETAEDMDIPFRCGGLEPMTTMDFTRHDGQDDTLLWHYFLQEMAVRGVLLRRGGLNFVNYSHTETDIDTVVAKTAEVFHELRQVWGTPALQQRVEARRAGTVRA